MGLIANLIRAGVDPDLIQEAHDELMAARTGGAGPSEADRREKDRVRKANARQREKEARETTERPRTTTDTRGQVSAVSADKRGPKEAPHTPKENSSPLPSAPKGASVSAPKGARSATAHRLPDDWSPTPSDLEYGRVECGLSHQQIDAFAEDMRLWAGSNGGAKARKTNWSLAFKGWMRREAGRMRERGPPGGKTTFASLTRESHAQVRSYDQRNEPTAAALLFDRRH